MADDLDRFLRDEPVEARRATPLGRLSRWCARNPVLAALGATVLVLLVLVAAVSSHKNVQLKRESDLGREKLRDSYLAQARAARLSGQPGQRFGSLQTLLDAAQIRPGPELCDEAAASLALDDVRLVKSWSKKPSQWVTFDDDVARYALPEANGEVVIRSTADDRELVRLPGPGHDVPFIDIGFHPDGRHAAVRYHKFNAYDRWTIWDLERREAVARLDDGIGTGGFDFDRRDGSFVATVRGNGLRAVEVPSGRVVSELRFRFAPGALSLHPGGELAAVAAAGDRERECHVIEQRSGRVLRTLLHEKRTWGVAWDPRGRFLAVGCDDFRVYLWDADTGALRWSQRGHQAQATSVAFHPTGSFLFSAGWDNQTIAWDTWTGHRLFTVPGGQAYPGKDGMRFGTRSRFEYQHFELASRPVEFVLHGHEKPDEKHPLSVALAPGGRLAASCGADGVRIWDLAGRAEVAHFPVSTVYSLEFAPDGGSLLASGRSGLLRWPIRSHVAGGRRRMVFGHPEPVVAVDDLWRHSSTGGGQVAFIHNRSRIHVRSLAGAGAGTAAAGKLELGTQLEPVPELAMVALSPDGCWVAGSSSQLEHVLIWDAISGQRVASVEAPYSSLGFDPRNRFLVAGAPQEYLFIRTGDWTVERRLPRASGLSFQAPLAFDPRGEVMVLAHSNSRLWLLEIESGRRLAELEASDPRELNGLALDLEGGFLAASSLSQRVYVWDLRAASRQLAACGLPWEVRCVGDGPGREGLQVEAVPRRSALGLARDVEDPRAPPLLRECRQALFLPSLRSYGEIDATLASPRFLVPEGVSWKYARGLSEPGEGLAWTTLEFDDRAWPAGPGGFGGSSSRDDETMTSLGDQRGVYSTLYLRHVFELDRADRVEKLLLALRFEDGFVAYLNGREVARRNAGEPGDRLPHDAVASRAMNTRLEFLSRIDAAPLLPGKNALAVQVLASQRSAYLFALPVLAAVHAADEAEDRRRTGAIARGPDGAPDLLLSAYAAGRVLERSGKLAEALSEYQRAGTMDPASPEPILRRAACLGALGEIEPCETLLRESLERGELIDDGGLWAEWSLVTFRDLRRPLTEALSTWPGGDKPTSRHGTDLRFVVAELASRGALRINCGGSACRSRDGTDWSEDRFYLGGVGLRGGTPDGASPVAGTELDPVYRDHRRFWGDREVRPGYRIPIPPGRYLVGLHFAETEAGKTGRRIFGALLERRTVLAGYEPLRAGFATAQVQSFEVEVTDGFLDLDFLAEEPNPILSGLSVERRP
jgi:WD40 repeat protein/tetratricopeptide (TPR) repeat protein